jgi:two-component system chemotaxis response regulator CheB
MTPRNLDAEPIGVPFGGVPLDVVVIGASTGGPPTVEHILRELPRDFPAPVAICQHMPPGFTETWALRLDSVSRLHVREARFGEPFEPGNAYLAPIGKHMRIKRENKHAVVSLDMDFADSLHVPSIDILMSSVAHAYGSRALAVLLTGLGTDGALGMLAVRRAGGHTITEAEDSAVAYSMPGSAVEIGAAAQEMTAAEMPAAIIACVSGKCL